MAKDSNKVFYPPARPSDIERLIEVVNGKYRMGWLRPIKVKV